MDVERWRRIKEIFPTVLDLAPEERAVRLAAALPDDPSLAAEVEDLLAAHDGADDFYDRGALAVVPGVREQLEGAVPGMRIGPYRILSELGRGGMGAVYLALRDEPGFTQKVALKLVKRGMDTDEIVRRFKAERQILASLSHPHIARLFDGGSTADGRPYFVMEYIEGRPITAFACERRLPVEARLRLFLRVCGAVQAAHQSLIVHRDLKPANILVDEAGEPKLLDFGIAKLLDPGSFGSEAALTGLTPGPMTPDYASPEQRAGAPVTTATDVYGLGLLLYELLVGHNPPAVERRLGAGWAERPPSQAVAALAPGDGESRRLARRLAGDLDTVVGKALAREPGRRYGTAAALAEDVERHLTQRPVLARRPTVAYRLGRTLVRHKLAAALAVGLCLFAATSSYQAWALRRERDRVEAQRRIAEAVSRFQRGMIQSASPDVNHGAALTVRQVLDAAASQLERDPPPEAEVRAASLEIVGNTYADLGLFQEARRHLCRALTWRERQAVSGREAALSRAANLTALGKVALRQEDYAASRGFFRRSLGLKERYLGATALAAVDDWHGLGLIAAGEGKVEEAARCFDRALAISRRAGESGQAELAASFNNLGTLAAGQKRFARARFLFRMVAGYFERSLGAENKDTLLAQSNLAFASFQLGDCGGAERLYREIAEVRRRLLGPGHPNRAHALLQLAITQHLCRRAATARTTLLELVEIRRNHPLPLDQDAAETWNLLGAVALERHDLAGAQEAYAKSYALYRSLPGDHRVDLENVRRGQRRVRLARSANASGPRLLPPG